MDKINYYLLFIITVTFTVITLGAYVRLSHAGLGCPDWPGCYGFLFGIPSGPNEILVAESKFYGFLVDELKAWKEMIHRYLAAFLGFFIFSLIYVFYKNKKLLFLSVLLSIIIIAQALLGMLTVALKLQPLIVMLHLAGGLTIISLLWLIFLKVNQNYFYNLTFDLKNISLKKIRNLLFFSYVVFIVLIIQILLGGWTSANYAALACTDFPKCHNEWFPKIDFYKAFFVEISPNLNYEFGRLDSEARVTIHYIHRIWAIFTAIMILCLSLISYKIIKNKTQILISFFLIFLLFIQITLGILNVKMSLPIYIAVAHNGNAVLLLLCLVTQLYIIKIIKNNLKI